MHFDDLAHENFIAFLESKLVNHHIVLREINDSYTHLRPGNIGVCTSVWSDSTKTIRIDVKWDNGSHLSLIQGLDQYDLLD
jgi:hypothetical protein